MNTSLKIFLISLLAGGVLLISSPITSAQTVSSSYLAQLAQTLEFISRQSAALEAEISSIETQIEQEEPTEPSAEPPPAPESSPPPAYSVPPAEPPALTATTSTSTPPIATTTFPILPPPPVATTTPTSTPPLLTAPPPAKENTTIPKPNIDVQRDPLLPPPPAAFAPPLSTITISEEPRFTEQFEPGDAGEDVADLQRFLAEQGYFDAERYPLGFYGSVTKSVLGNWQESQGIVRRGTITTTGKGRWGPKTIAQANKNNQQKTKQSANQLKNLGFLIQQSQASAPISTTITKTKPKEKVHMVYTQTDKSARTALKYATWDGVNTPQVKTIDNSMNSGASRGNVDMKLDSKGNVHLVYANYRNTPFVAVIYKFNNQKSEVITAFSSVLSIFDVHIDADSKDNPIVVMNSSTGVLIAKKSANQWIIWQTFPMINAMAGIEFDIDSVGNYHIFYMEINSRNFMEAVFAPNLRMIKNNLVLKEGFNFREFSAKTNAKSFMVYTDNNFPIKDYLIISNDNWVPKRIPGRSHRSPGLEVVADTLIWALNSLGANLTLHLSADGGKNWFSTPITPNTSALEPGVSFYKGKLAIADIESSFNRDAIWAGLSANYNNKWTLKVIDQTRVDKFADLHIELYSQ